MTPVTVVHWFRNDLRLGDHPSWAAAVQEAQARQAALLAVYVWDPAQAQATRFSPVRCGPLRHAWLADTLAALDAALQSQGQRLLVLRGTPDQALPVLLHTVAAVSLHTERLPAPEEHADEVALARALPPGVPMRLHAPSVLLPEARLPWSPDHMPDGFTPMRQAIEADQARHGDPWSEPLPAPASLPAPPALAGHEEAAVGWPDAFRHTPLKRPAHGALRLDARSAFPFLTGGVLAGEAGAWAHLQAWLGRGGAHRYKTTRNQLLGLDFSSKWSPWLALGAVSAPQLMQGLRRFETEHGANEGTYWLWFELLWREHFRLLQHKHGRALYRWRGLCDAATARQRQGRRAADPAPLGSDSAQAQAWRSGRTGQPLVDAGMRELAATGFLSNRMRQIVASWLVHDLGVDWRVGAAWFEAQLIDFDVQSNQGNWLYLAGLGTDPRGGRRFDPIKQAREHDPDGSYQRCWSVT